MMILGFKFTSFVRSTGQLSGRRARPAARWILLCAAVWLLPRAATAGPSDTAFADLNADGHPDVAVTHVATGADGSNYRIDVRLSNGRRQSVSFVSPHRALTIRALDVDNDHDLDLIVTPLLGRDIVSVWLNDGTGHFRKGDPDAVPYGSAVLSNVHMRGDLPPIAIAVSVPRRAAAALAQQPRPPTPAAGVRLVVGTADRVPRHLLDSQHSPRAPPAHA